MSDFSAVNATDGFRVKVWRGESMCLLGFDVDEPEDDFVGFAVEYQEPGSQKWLNLRNRLTFDRGTMPLMFSGSAKFARRNAVRGRPSRFDGQSDAVGVGDETHGHR